MQVRQPQNLPRTETNQMLYSVMKMSLPCVQCLLPHLRLCPSLAGPAVGASEVQPVGSRSSLVQHLLQKPASLSSMKHHHFCPEREKHRFETALGDPNREYLKHQRNEKWGLGHLFNLPCWWQQQKESSECSGQKNQEAGAGGWFREQRCCGKSQD